jgi:hypothetical protein
MVMAEKKNIFHMLDTVLRIVYLVTYGGLLEGEARRLRYRQSKISAILFFSPWNLFSFGEGAIGEGIVFFPSLMD